MAQEPGLVVADASVVLKWQFDDEDCVSQATALRDDFYDRGVVSVIAPDLLLYELVNGITTATRRGRLSQDKAEEALSNLLALGIELREVAPLRVLEASLRHNLSAYDAAYLTLAEAEKCALWTGDRTFHRAVKDELPQVKWIGDYTGKEGPAAP